MEMRQVQGNQKLSLRSTGSLAKHSAAQHSWICSLAEPQQCWAGAKGPRLSLHESLCSGQGCGGGTAGLVMAIKAYQCIQGPDMHIW